MCSKRGYGTDENICSSGNLGQKWLIWMIETCCLWQGGNNDKLQW